MHARFITGGWDTAFKWNSDTARKVLVLLCFALVLDMQVRYSLVAMRNAVFWRDEAQHLQLAREHLFVQARHFLQELEPYSYILTLRIWTDLFGAHEAGARSLSAFCVMLATLLLYRLGRRWFRERTAALALATLVGCSPMVLERIATVTKPYAFSLLACVLLLERVISLETSRQRIRSWLGVFFAAVLAGNAQPVGFAWMTALGVLWMRRRLGESAGFHRKAIAALTVPTLMMIAASPSLVQAVRFAAEETGCARIAAGTLGVPYFAQFGLRVLGALNPLMYYGVYHALDDYPRAGIPSLVRLPPETGALVALLAVPAVGLVLIAVWKSSRWSAVDALILGTMPIVLLGLGGLVNARMVWVWKSFSAVAAGTAMMVVVLLRPARRLLAVLVAVTLLRTAVHLPSYAATHDGKSSDARDAARFVSRLAHSNDVIVLANTALSPAFSYYYGGPGRQVHHPYDHAIRYYRMMEMYRFQGEKWRAERTAEIMRRAGREGRRVWFLEGGTPEPLPAHRWYSPQDLPLFRDTLRSCFNLVTNREFNTTLEPFRVSLWRSAAATE